MRPDRGERGAVAGAGILVALAALALGAPWLPLRDPSAQPDGVVLRDLPPLSRIDAVRKADGTVVWAAEVRERADGIEVRRGTSWTTIPASELAGTDPALWHGRPLFLLGTDGFGRDVLSRLVHGARVSLFVGALGATLALLLGGSIGLAAGFAGGLVDGLLMRFTDLVLAVPRLFLALALVTVTGPSLAGTVLVLGATTWMPAARLVRGEILGARSHDWALAARATGSSPLRQALAHLLPAALAPLLVEAALRVGDTILLEATLSFLGLGVPPPTPSWGNLIADGRHAMLGAWWIATFPGIAVALTVLALHLTGERLRRRLA